MSRRPSASRALLAVSLAPLMLAALVALPAHAEDPWRQKSLIYLNYESKLRHAVNGTLWVGFLYVQRITDPNDPNYVDPNDPNFPHDPNNFERLDDPISGLPRWLVPPDNGAAGDGPIEPALPDNSDPNDTDEPDPPTEESSPEGPETPDYDTPPPSLGRMKIIQPAFSARVFNVARSRSKAIHAITNKTKRNLKALHLDLDLIFDPVTHDIRPGILRGPLGLGRGDFKFLRIPIADPDGMGRTIWALTPTLGDGDPARTRIWLATVGGPHMSLHGEAFFMRVGGPRTIARLDADDCTIYVYSNNQAADAPGTYTLFQIRTAVSHVLTHEIGHTIGANAEHVLPLWRQDASGHWLCAAIALPANGRPDKAKNIMTHGRCMPLGGVGGFKRTEYGLHFLDAATFLLNLGPDCAKCRGVSALINRILKPPAPPPPAMPGEDALAAGAWLASIHASGAHYTPSIKQAAIAQLVALHNWVGPVSEGQIQAVIGPGGAIEALMAELADGGISDAECATMPGDLDGDGVVGVHDLAVLYSALGTTLGHPDYVMDADYDCDLDVDAFDCQMWRALALYVNDDPGLFIESCLSEASDTPGAETYATGDGALTRIIGICEPSDADLYRLNICSPGTFRATTNGVATFDTALWLFRTNGLGLAFNDDDPASATTLQSTLTGTFVPGNGTYLLGISGWDHDAVASTNAELWLDTPFTTQRAPDGPGRFFPLHHWTGVGEGGAYQITLTGACHAPPPCPGDTDGDGRVNLSDLARMLANFGTSSGATRAMGDFNGDGDVDLTDLATLLGNFGSICP